MWIALANDPSLESRDLSSLVTAGSGGAPLPVEVARLFERKTGLQLKSGWGMTETCSPGTGHPPEGPGQARLDRADAAGHRAATSSRSTIRPRCCRRAKSARSASAARTSPKATGTGPRKPRKSFVGDRFLTGDIGYMDADGYFFLVDRKKDMIISGGFNVYPQMIEQAIYEHPAVQEVIVIGIPDDYRGEAAKAFITLRAGAAPFTVDELREFLTGKLGKHELPAAVEFVDELPRTPVGKLSRHELRNQLPRSTDPSQQQTAQGARS